MATSVVRLTAPTHATAQSNFSSSLFLKSAMFDFNTLSDFSRANCISICAFLVPANLVATSLTIALTVLRRPRLQIWQSAGIASTFAVVMLIHVWTWFAIGVVMIPTYVLLWLATTCLLANSGAILLRKRLANATYTFNLGSFQLIRLPKGTS